MTDTIKKIIIFGTAGNCIDILDAINEINAIQPKYECIGFLDDNETQWGKELYGKPVLGPLIKAVEYGNDCYFVNGIGSVKNYYKKEVIIASSGVQLERFESIIHPSASVSKMSEIGYGTVILQNVTVASNVTIGNHVMILPNSVISHDDIIKDYTSIAGGVCISGGVTIGKSCYLGTNSSIIGNVSIGDYSLIGMGSVVLKKVEDNDVMIGNPSKFLRKGR